jgi:hypothetical protein
VLQNVQAKDGIEGVVFERKSQCAAALYRLGGVIGVDSDDPDSSLIVSLHQVTFAGSHVEHASVLGKPVYEIDGCIAPIGIQLPVVFSALFVVASFFIHGTM